MAWRGVAWQKLALYFFFLWAFGTFGWLWGCRLELYYIIYTMNALVVS
jgi:hypothetical protein